jgi:hypothetical protein
VLIKGMYNMKERKNKRKKERATAKVEHNKKVVAKVVQEHKDIYTKKEPIKIDRLFIYL